MRTTSRSPHPTVALLLLSAFLGGFPTLAQSPSPPSSTDPAVVPDDMLTLVVGTRFVAPAANAISPRAQFTDARIPLSAFNETDHCIDQLVLEVAQEYFASLGRMLGKAGYFYFVPESEIKKSVLICEKLHRRSPQAWVEGQTKIIAFGKVVPTNDAPALEASIR